MANRTEERFSPPAVGGTSLLVVFAVLCLTVFALLSLSTVRADVRLADASARAVTNYYAADCQAQAVLAWLRTGEGKEQLQLPEDFTMTTTISDYPDHSETVYAYAIPISVTQELQVEVQVGSDGSYTILRWQAVPTGEWEADMTLEVWDGTLF